MTKNPEGENGPDKDDLAERLRKLSPEERQELLAQLEDNVEIPILRWSSNPNAVKEAFRFVHKQGTATFEELRAHLHSQDLIDAEKGSYKYGIVDHDEQVFFRVNGKREADTEISLTDLGQRYAEAFENSADLTPFDRTVLFGMQPYGSAFRFLGILERHRDDGGVLREELEEEMKEEYGGTGSFYTGYWGSWFSKLGIIEKEDVGRKVKYKLTVPAGW